MITIRLATPADAEALAEVYERSVRALGPRASTPAQIAAWIGQGGLSDRFHARLADGRRCWAAVDAADRVQAFVDLEADGHIDVLYAAPEAAGTDGLTRLHVEASEAARRFFLKRGYSVVERRDFAIGGVDIHNYAMERRL